MKRKILFIATICIWMGLLLAPQTTFAVTISNPRYLLSTLDQNNRNLKFTFDLTGYTTSDKIKVTLFSGSDRKILKGEIKEFNNGADSAENPHEGENYCMLKNLKEGTYYFLVFSLNGVEKEYGILTPGTAPLVAENTAVLATNTVDIHWLYSSENKPDEFQIIFDNKETFLYPSYILDLKYKFMFNNGKPNSATVDYDSMGLPGEEVHYKILARSGNETIETTVQKFLIPKGQTGAIKKRSTATIEIFPNPAKDHFTLKAPPNNLLRIYDCLGKLYYTTLTTGSNTYIETIWPSGIYTTLIESNGTVTTKKITIK